MLGDESKPLDEVLSVGSIIIDGGLGNDVVWIHNEAATSTNVEVENIDYTITTDELSESSGTLTVDFGQGACGFLILLSFIVFF